MNVLREMKTNTQEVESLVRKLSTLNEVTDRIPKITNLEEVFAFVLQRAMRTVEAQTGSIMLLDEKTNTLSIAAAEGLDESIANDIFVRVGEGIAERVAETGEAVLVEDIENDSRFAKVNDLLYQAASFVSLPIQVQGRVIGVLNLAGKENHHPFNEADLRFLSTLLSYVSHVSFASENARLLEEAREATTQLRKVAQEKTLQLDKVQQQVIHSVKLSSLGQLIAGVAHEVNNPLTVVMGYSQLLLDQVPEGKIRQDLGKIFNEAKRAAKIVQGLLAFARQAPAEKVPCNVNDIISRVLEIGAYDLLVNDIDVTTELSPDVSPIMVDSSQLQQVLLNLLNNARQAMAEQARPRKLTLCTKQEKDRVCIECSDTGAGIAQEHVERIFEPFFTTKAQGKGTGLGLSISYGIIHAHGGEISVTSRVNEGTTLVIKLPVEIGGSLPTETEATTAQRRKTAIGKVLVIDDEEAVNTLMVDILKREGYQVDSVLSGERAFQKVLMYDYDIVVCDLRMPGMDGRRVFMEASQAKPHLSQRFVFVTGDIVSEDARAFLLETGNFYIMKPFTPETFLDVIAQTWCRVVGEGELHRVSST